MSLSAFIGDHHETIISEFAVFAKTLMPPGADMTEAELRDHAEDCSYAERFDTVEINNTFYRPPAVTTAQSWADRTPPHFEFSLKLFQQFTTNER